MGVGSETVQNAQVRLADLSGGYKEAQTGSNITADVSDPEMLLGDDFVKAHRIYIARDQRKLYFTYNGGPIFESPKLKPAASAAAH